MPPQSYDMRGRDVLMKRLMDICELMQYGNINIEVIAGLPKIITSINQTIRLDLTDPKEDGIMKVNLATDHNDGRPKPSSSS